MQGALLYFGNYDVDPESGKLLGTYAGDIGNNTPTPTQYNASGMVPIVAIGINLTNQRQVAKRYPINVRRVIYMVGNPDGQMTIQCLFGPNQTMATFLQYFNAIGSDSADPYKSKGTSIFIKPFGQMYSNSNSQGKAQQSTLGLGTWVVVDPVITGIGLTVSESGSSQIPAVANVSFTFSTLDIV